MVGDSSEFARTFNLSEAIYVHRYIYTLISHTPLPQHWQLTSPSGEALMKGCSGLTNIPHSMTGAFPPCTLRRLYAQLSSVHILTWSLLCRSEKIQGGRLPQ